jgi:hypothetical protein
MDQKSCSTSRLESSKLRSFSDTTSFWEFHVLAFGEYHREENAELKLGINRAISVEYKISRQQPWLYCDMSWDRDSPSHLQMLDQSLLIGSILLLTLGRLAYLGAMPIQRDVRQAQLPLSKRLRISDFFRKPRSQEVIDSFRTLPYGILWFAINLPIMHIASFQGRRWTYLLALIDTPFILLSFRLGLVGALIYIGIGTFMLFQAPWNLSILWLTVLAVLSWVFLLLAPIAKLPVGIPMRLGKRVQTLLFHQRNYVYYSLLGILWLFVAWRTLLPWFLATTLLGQIVTFGS